MKDRMEILYISSVCSGDIYSNLEKILKKPMLHCIQKFHNLIINGIDQNDKTFITALCGIPIDRTNTKKVMFKKQISNEKNIKYIHLSFFNIPVIKQVSICFGMLKNLIVWYKKNKNNPNKIIICDASYVTVTPFIVFASKILNIKRIAIVADIYRLYDR